MSGASILEISHIDIFHGIIQAVWDISFQVDEGEIVTLLGSNGAGKTTTVKTIQGLMRPTSGEILFRCSAIHRMQPHEIVSLGLCLVPEDRSLFPFMDVMENLELGAYTRRAREKRKETMEWVYKLFPVLKERRRQKVHTLSGGEQQMVAIARGLMALPHLLMLDEPSQGLAPLLVEELFGTISTVSKEGISILLVEQNIFKALQLANRAYVLENGRIVRAGRTGDLLEDAQIRSAYLGM
jgi:branched-chain amino acid transport system ATP-binding protein